MGRLQPSIVVTLCGVSKGRLGGPAPLFGAMLVPSTVTHNLVELPLPDFPATPLYMPMYVQPCLHCPGWWQRALTHEW